ncbi:MAG: S-layer protein [Theionarchaea archaeon]|nr:S-layer protein [Theionarchaea archaeon]
MSYTYTQPEREEGKTLTNKKPAAILIGIALLCTMASIDAQPNVIPPRDFFVDPETGEPRVFIIVGEKATGMDVVSATIVAALIFTFAYPEEPEEIIFTKTYKLIHENIDPFMMDSTLQDSSLISVRGLGFPTVDIPYGKPDACDFNDHNINYKVGALWYQDDPHGFWGNADEDFQPWETHEEIQIRFDDFSHMQIPAHDCAASLYGGNVVYRKPDEVKPWNWYNTPGLIYRADNIFAPPMVQVDTDSPPLPPFLSSRIDLYTDLFIPEPFFVYQDMLPQFNFFDTVFTVVDAGPVLDIDPFSGEHGPFYGMPYIITGEPHMGQSYISQNESKDFSSYTVELKTVDIHDNTAYVSISKNGKFLEAVTLPCSSQGLLNAYVEFPFDIYRNCRDLNSNGKVDPGELNDTSMYDSNNDGVLDFHKWVMDQKESPVWADYTWKYYKDHFSRSWLLFNRVDFLIEITEISDNSIVVNVYWLENSRNWYNQSCSDPWVSNPSNYQLFLDAYESGWDLHDTTQLCQPPGTGLWPPYGLNQWRNSTFIGNGFLDNNDGHIGYEYTYFAPLPDLYFPEQNDFDMDSDITNDCRYGDCLLKVNCTDLYDIEDPVVWHGSGVIMVELNVCLCRNMSPPEQVQRWDMQGPYLEDTPSFSIEVHDIFFSCGDGSGIEYYTIMKLVMVTRYRSIIIDEVDETVLVKVDTEFNFEEWKSSCPHNLILVGGPVVNSVVKKLVNEGLSKINWTVSPGHLEYIREPYGVCSILIIAGADRECTRKAVSFLVTNIQSRSY